MKTLCPLSVVIDMEKYEIVMVVNICFNLVRSGASPGVQIKSGRIFETPFRYHREDHINTQGY